MAPRRLIIPAVLVLASPWWVAVAGRASSGAAPCGPSSARTLVQSSRARVYEARHRVYACLNRHNAIFLGDANCSCMNNPSVSQPRLARRFVGYALAQHGVDTVSSEVLVRDLSSGRTVHRESARRAGESHPESFTEVTALVLKRDGSAAWISQTQSIGVSGREREVDRADRRGSAVLDFGPDIRPQSLRLHRSTVTWIRAGEPRSADLH